MRGYLGKYDCRRLAAWPLFLAPLLLAGCTTAGGLFGISPPRHTMLDTAKTLRQSGTGAQPLPRELDKRALPPYTVEPGDVLLVTTADLDSPVRFPGDQPVLLDGTINLGRYGRLVVAGKTAEEIEGMVRTAVTAQLTEKDKEVGPITVRIVTRASKVYYVLGEVNAPGSFQLNGRETVLDGIVAAGGLTDRASRQNIILSRPTHPDGCRVVLPICYPQIVQLGDTTTNYQLAPGDRIFVASKTCWEQLCSHRQDNGLCCCPQTSCLSPAGCPAGDHGAGHSDGTPPQLPGWHGPAHGVSLAKPVNLVPQDAGETVPSSPAPVPESGPLTSVPQAGIGRPE
jgi:protein involved in polysaccharide export with SLBB domain